MNYYVLGLETSCDETSAAIIDSSGVVLSNIVYSQINLHEKFGGIVPELASRDHAFKIHDVVSSSIEKAKLKIEDINYVSATIGPGLLGCLLTGVSFGKAFSMARNIPFIPIDHIKAHFMSVFIDNKKISYPFLGMVVSGGHTSIYLVSSVLDIKLISSTLDDAAGEVFDKIARFIGLGYPGGKALSDLARKGDPTKVKLTKPVIKRDKNSFSFSGIKTSVINKLSEIENLKLDDENVLNILASFEKLVADILVDKLIYFSKLYNIKDIVIGGGVAANYKLRETFLSKSKENGKTAWLIDREYCTDNAAMIANYGRLFVEAKIFPDIFKIKPYATGKKK
jgi:N6-L-threonylcarbamoyladenine synthase